MALDLVAAPASQAYVEHAFSVCSDMCAGKCNRMCIIFTVESYTKYKARTACLSANEQEILGKCAAVG